MVSGWYEGWWFDKSGGGAEVRHVGYIAGKARPTVDAEDKSWHGAAEWASWVGWH